MKMRKYILKLTVALLLMVGMILPSTSFSAVDPQAVQVQIEEAVAAAQAAGADVDADLIESIAADVMARNIDSGDNPVMQVEAVADAIVQAVVALHTTLGLPLADVVPAAGRGAVQGVENVVASGVIPASLSSALQVAANDGSTTGAQQAGVPMDTVLLIGSTPPDDPAGTDETDPDDLADTGETDADDLADADEPDSDVPDVADEPDTDALAGTDEPAGAEPLDPGEVEAFEPVVEAPIVEPPPPLTPTPIQDLDDSSPM